MCKAKTLTGKRCSRKAVIKGYCKQHYNIEFVDGKKLNTLRNRNRLQKKLTERLDWVTGAELRMLINRNRNQKRLTEGVEWVTGVELNLAPSSPKYNPVTPNRSRPRMVFLDSPSYN